MDRFDVIIIGGGPGGYVAAIRAAGRGLGVALVERDELGEVFKRDVFLQAEQEYSRHNFDIADTGMLFEQFRMAEAACREYLADGWAVEGNVRRHRMALPAYDQCIKASHVFNLLDARGVISVTERQSYILRVRELAKACGEAWLATEGGGTGARA